MSARTSRSDSGRRGTPGGVTSLARPAAQLEEHRGVVAVRRHRRAERELPEVLQQVVQLVEGRVAGCPQPVALARTTSGANVDSPSR